MKIYNELVTIFNDVTGQWETLYEDYEEYNGYIALAQGVPPNSTAISAQDTIADTVKTTAGYFTNGDGTLGGSDIHTASLSDSNQKYYFNANRTFCEKAPPARFPILAALLPRNAAAR